MVKIDINEIKRLNLKRILEEKKLKSVELANIIGVKPSYISALLKKTGEKGSRNLGENIIEKISKKLCIDRSEFYRFDVLGVDIPEYINKPIPVISWIKAGNLDIPIQNSDIIEHVFSRKKVSPQAFSLIVKGDSMEPRYLEGDKIIVDPEIQCENGDPCIVRINEEVTFKIFNVNDNEIRLKALNKKYPDMVIPKNGKVDFQIIGKVVDMIPKLK